MRIRKRDGSIQPFNADKIKRAMLMAFNAVQPQDIPDVNGMCADVCSSLEVFAPSNTVTIEQVQDQIERTLIAFNAASVAKAFILYREEHARLRAVRLQPDPSALQDYIHPAKYGRFLPELCRRETYEESCGRVITMFEKKFPDQKLILNSCLNAMLDKRILPSMRCMQFAGLPVEQHNARMYNCSFTHIDRVSAFSEAFYLLLCGCGVGYSVQYKHVQELPEISKPNERIVHHYRIPDSIEGWADSLYNLLSSYTAGGYVEFDYSDIRPEGAALRSGGRAPGHLPLKRMHERTRLVLDKAIDRQLRPIEAHDILCHVAEAVLSGGIRRSSLIALFSHDDGEMLRSKHPENFEHLGKNSQRAMANNSAAFLRKDTTEYQFRRVMDLNYNNPNGEPGFFFTDNLDYGTNPCGEIGLNPKILGDGDGNGRTGFAFCNLTEVNVAACKNSDEFFCAAELASYLGTFQATYTDFSYLSPASREIAEREALIGVGLTGLADNLAILSDGDVLEKAARIVKEANAFLANEIGINHAARCTTVKPSGTASLELGCVGSGIHRHHARRYFRRITANPNESVAQLLRRTNPHMVVEKPNGDWSITFPVQAPDGAVTVKEESEQDFLDSVFLVYERWIRTGTQDETYSPGLTHNVSCTVTFDPDNWPDIVSRVWHNRNRIAAMAFIPKMSDKGIPFMPREEVSTSVDEALWHSLIENYKPVNYKEPHESSDGTNREIEPACAAGACEIQP